MLDVTIEGHQIRVGERFALAFYRTLRIPDDGKTYPLPPGLGRFPLLRVAEYRDQVPRDWLAEGGAFIPMYQREALWLGFSAAEWKPNAVKIAVGGVNAISGEPDKNRRLQAPQDYIVCPDQIWLDGINAGHGTIRQFVAMPLGYDYTVEASVTGTEETGGIQVTVFEPKAGRFPDGPPPRSETGPVRFAAPAMDTTFQPMGLGAGGEMRQKIYPDPHGLDVWDQDSYGRVVVHIVNSAHFLAITGIAPPPTPVDAKAYTQHGLPWFDLYDETKGDVPPSEKLTEVETIAKIDTKRGKSAAKNEPVDVSETQIKKIDRENFGRRKSQSSSPGSDPLGKEENHD